MGAYIIRPMRQNEIPLLRDFLYEAIFQRDEQNLLPRDIVDQPEIRVFIDDFGKPDDHCLIAEMDGKPAGAVWCRILGGEVKGFGHVDDETPEFAISLYKEYRGMGIGAAMMRAMLELLREKGYRQTSLAVQKDNYAVGIYEQVGFRIIRELEEEYLMLCTLGEELE